MFLHKSIPCSPECKNVGKILLDHPLIYALTTTTDVLVVYLQQFWKTVIKMPDIEDTIIFKLYSQETVYTVDMFQDTLNLSVETLEKPFVAPINIEIIESFMNRVSYQGVVDKVSTFYMKNLAQPWQTMFKYPRSTKLIIADLMKKFSNISQRIYEDYHSIKDDIPLVSVYTTGNVLVRGMLISEEFLTEEIRATNDYKEYETVFVNVVVLINQPQPVVFTQGMHRPRPRAHRTPTLTSSSPQGKKRKQSVGESKPGSHKENPEYVDDDDKEEEKVDAEEGNEMGSLEIRTEKMQTPIPTTLRSPRINLSSDKNIIQELKQRRISSKYNHLPDIHEITLIPQITERATDDLIENNLKPCIAETIIEDRDAFRSKVHDLVSKEFNSHAPQIIEELFKQYVQNNMKRSLQDRANDIALWEVLKHDDAPPKGEKILKRQKTSKSSKSARGSLSKRTTKDFTTYVFKQQQQQQEWDAWVKETIVDEDEVIPEDKTPELITEFQNVDKRVPTIFDRARMEATLNDMLSNQFKNAEEYAYHLEQATNFMENQIVWKSRQEDIRRPIPRPIERVHDFQLEIDIYQVKVNLTAPTLTFLSIETHEPYSINDTPTTGLIYLNNKDEKQVMYLVVIMKFYDAILENVLKEVKLKIFQSEPWKKPPPLAMSPPDHKKFRLGVGRVAGRRSFTDPKTGLWVRRISRKIQILIDLYPCQVEEMLIVKEVKWETIMKYETKITSNDGTVTKLPREFPRYPPSNKEEEEPNKGPNYELLSYTVSNSDSDLESTARNRPKCSELEDTYESGVNVNGGNDGNGGNGGNNGCSYKGFMACNPKEYDGKGGAIALTRWTKKMDNVIDNSRCSKNQKVKYVASSFVNKDLTWWNTQVQARGREAAIGLSWTDFKALLVEELCPSNEMEKLETEFWNHRMVEANHVSYINQFYELAKLVLHLVTPESSRIKRYIASLAPEIRGMLQATQPTIIQSEILRARILTDEAVSCGTLTKGNEKRKGVEETSKLGGSWKENKKAKVGIGFVATAPPRNEFVGSCPKCAKCYSYHPENRACKLCFNCQKLGHFAKDCQAPYRQVAPVNAVRMGKDHRVCYECGSSDHLCNTCPKMNRAPGQAGNPLALKGNRNTRNNGKRTRGRAFNVNAVEALQGPNVVTCTFSLNDHFATILFNSGADFSFISTEFAPLLNVKPSIVNPGYMIEVAYGKKVEVDRIIRDCKLELENSLFSINFIPLGHGSFDVIVGMDWLSQNKVVIVCHEKVVKIPLECSGILRVQGERTSGVAKALMNVKVDEPKLSDIPVVRDFVDVFPEDLSGLPPPRQVEFRIDLVPGATL
ncbi:putative reverse transcriptase domain-containing protein, partial [Tanacetum coccineum]